MVLRIIPARAGQTAAHDTMQSASTDHPRACGANLVKLKDTGDRFGSSPRVRGKRHGTDHEHETARIIPARAGQTGCPPI